SCTFFLCNPPPPQPPIGRSRRRTSGSVPGSVKHQLRQAAAFLIAPPGCAEIERVRRPGGALYGLCRKASLLGRQAVDVLHAVGANRRHRVARHDDADQVERIGGVDDDPLLSSGRFAHAAELLDRRGQRVLLTTEAGNEAAAADQTTVFEAPQRPLKLAPGHTKTVVQRQVAEQDTPAVQELLSNRLGQIVAVDLTIRWRDEGPSASRRGAAWHHPLQTPATPRPSPDSNPT